MGHRHSDSLLLVWKIAEIEAKYLHSDDLEPVHLLLGFLKIVDLDLAILVSGRGESAENLLEEHLREVRRIRAIFKSANLDPKRTRRTMRKAFANASQKRIPKGRLRRNAQSREAFSQAEQLADKEDSFVYPVHLLYTTLLIPDRKIERIIKELGIDVRTLRKSAKREILKAKANLN